MADKILYIGERDALMIRGIMDSVLKPIAAPEEAQNTEDSDDAAPVQNWRTICWGRQGLALHPQFLEGVIWIEEQLGINANLLMACMKFESDLNPKARNPNSSASGLIQFMSSTALQLGTTIEKIRAMDAMTQLSYVYRYFKQFGTELHDWDLADVYMAILWPKAIGKPADFRLFLKGEEAYRVNAGLDANKDGFITKKEAAAKVLALYEKGLERENMAQVLVD